MTSPSSDPLSGAPRVSVVLPLYNAAQFVDEAIASVVAQSYDAWELIIVDDGSTDGGDRLAAAWAARASDRIRLFRHPENRNLGATSTRNLGLKHARGELLAFIDADDAWPSDKLHDQVAIFDQHPELGMVAGAALYWSSWSGGSDKLVPAGHLQDQVVPGEHALLFVYPLGRAQAPCPSAVMVRRGVLDRIGGFEAHLTGVMQLYEDQAFLAKVYLDGPVYFASACWLRYRQHPDSCVSQVLGQGRYDQVRRQFLDWLNVYLRRHRRTRMAVRLSLIAAKMPYQAPWLYRAGKALKSRVPIGLRQEIGRVRRGLARL